MTGWQLRVIGGWGVDWRSSGQPRILPHTGAGFPRYNGLMLDTPARGSFEDYLRGVASRGEAVNIMF